MAYAKKSLGQHFLMHEQIAERMAHEAGLPDGLPVFEVGPGRGILTRVLLHAGHPVVAVEADHDLVAELRDTFASFIADGTLTLHEGDIRAFDLSTLPPQYAVVSNIPYYLTGELLRLFLSAAHQPVSLTFLVQKEVADRIARSPKESILSISVKAYGTPKYAFTVPRGAFSPAPAVDSAVLVVRDISRTHFASHAEEERFFTLVHAGFAHKRKRLAGNLAAAGLPTVGVPEMVRAEDVPLEEWVRLVRIHTAHPRS